MKKINSSTKKTLRLSPKFARSTAKKTLRLHPASPTPKKTTRSNRVPYSRRKVDKTVKLGTFIYLDNYGQGEAIRMMLWLSKRNYTNIVVDNEQLKMMREKGQLPTGQVPVWVTLDKKVMPHKDSIMRYVGKLTGYYSSNPNEAYDADWSLDTLNEICTDKFFESWISDKPPSKG
jgi:hypothetical protein